ncbi:putative tetratricopeptide-like helical domain superfamily [Helianthus annuus]|nr:putative tetratricopeptide-like helical domain superfamily [Helianthus annuus]
MIISHLRAFIKFKGDSFLLPLQNPLSSSRLGLDFSTHATLLASLLHSNSFSNHDRPLSKFQNIANLDHACNLFDEMTQRRPLPSVVKFNQLLNAVAKMNHFSCSLDLFKRMCLIGVPVNEYSISIAIRCCCQMSRTNDGFALLASCFRRAVVPNVFVFSTLLDGLILEDRMIEAERLFKKLIKHKLCEPNVVTYSTMIKGLCKFPTKPKCVLGFEEINIDSAFSVVGYSDDDNFSSSCFHQIQRYQKVANLDHAFNLFDEMTQRRPLPSVVKFNQLLNAVAKMNHFSCSLDLFKQMCLIGVPVNEYSISIAIKCCCQMYRTNDGFALLASCFRRAVVPNVYIFSTLLDGLVIEDRILEAENFFKKLIKQKLCEPDVVMYSTMIKGLCKFGNNDIAIGLLRLMDERGCNPNVVVYSSIIYSLCKDKLIEDAFKLFNEMVFAKGIQPDVITYNSLIHGLCNLCRWDEVSKLLKEMEEDLRISPDLHTFSILVDALCKEGRVDEAEAVIDIMVERRVVPDIVTYNTLIDGYCLRGEMTKARTLFDSLTSKGFIPNIVTYSSLLNGYCKSLKIEEAMHLFHEITRKGLKPCIVTYSTMLQGLFRVGRCGAARKFFDEMRAQGLIPDECTYGIILDGFCNNHQVEEALSLFHLVGDSKLNYNIVVYNILIDGMSKCGKLDIARDLFQDLTLKGLQPDVRTYTVMVSGLCGEGLLKEAKHLFRKMDESGCPPDGVTYNVLLQGYLKNQNHDDVEMLLQEMDGRRYSLDASTLSLLIDEIAAGSVDRSMLKLIGKLVPKEMMDTPA